MRTLHALCLSSITFLFGACAVEECPSVVYLGSPNFVVRESSNPFSGKLNIYPCDNGTSTFYGNYVNNVITSQIPEYTILAGSISSSTLPMLAPIGPYSVVYWGEEPSDNYFPGQLLSPSLAISDDITNKRLSCVSIGEGVSSPVPSLCFSSGNITIGSNQSITVNLSRKVAGVRVILKNEDGTPLSSDIISTEARVGGIFSQISLLTGDVDTRSPSVTIAIPLTISDDRMQATNKTAFVFPSLDQPFFTVLAVLANGSKVKFSTTLASPLVAGDIRVLNITIDKITSEFNSSASFSVSAWTESTETIGSIDLR